MHPRKAIHTLAAVAALAVATGCETTAADPVPQSTIVLPPPQPTVVATQAPAPATVVSEKKEVAPAPTTNLVAEPKVANTSTNEAPDIKEEVPPTIPENLKVTPETEKVIKLAQGGVDENVMLAFVEKAQGKFDLEADEIVYLSDLGVPSTVLTAMLKKDGVDPAKATALTAATDTEADQPEPKANAQPPVNGVVQPPTQVVEVTTNYVPNTTVVQPAPQTVIVQQQPQTVVVAPPPTETVSYFYDSLSPYGSWMYVSDYGWCWQPTVAVVDHGWRPYGPRGHWVYSTSGWYWHSDYSWGWAPFHYGRWHHGGPRGWLWVPDREWGPAWVSWRVTDDYCGWAPLPPAAIYRPGFGFSYYGSSVGVSFGFGLGYDAYCFAPISRFHDRHVWRHSVWGPRAHGYYDRSYVHNRYDWSKDHHHPVNNGIPRTQVERAINRELRPVAVHEAPAQQTASRAGTPREQFERRGRDSVIVRPSLPRPEMASSIRTSSRATTPAPAPAPASVSSGIASSGRFNRSSGGSTTSRTSVSPAPSSPEPAPARPSRSTANVQPSPSPAPSVSQPSGEPRSTPSRRDRVIGSTSPSTPPTTTVPPPNPTPSGRDSIRQEANRSISTPSTPAPIVTAPNPTPSGRDSIRWEVNRSVSTPSTPAPIVTSPAPTPSSTIPAHRDRAFESQVTAPSPRAVSPAPQPVTPLPRISSSPSPSPSIATPSPRYSSPAPVTVSPSPRYSSPAPSPVSPGPSRSYQSTPSTSGRYSSPAPSPAPSVRTPAPAASPAPSRASSNSNSDGGRRDRRDR